MSMEQRRTPDRRRRSRNGRRATDPRPETIDIEARQEVARLTVVVARLKKAVQKLADAVQALTASRRKP